MSDVATQVEIDADVQISNVSTTDSAVQCSLLPAPPLSFMSQQPFHDGGSDASDLDSTESDDAAGSDDDYCNTDLEYCSDHMERYMHCYVHQNV